jgi:hypothetical protein
VLALQATSFSGSQVTGSHRRLSWRNPSPPKKTCRNTASAHYLRDTSLTESQASLVAGLWWSLQKPWSNKALVHYLRATSLTESQVSPEACLVRSQRCQVARIHDSHPRAAVSDTCRAVQKPFFYQYTCKSYASQQHAEESGPAEPRFNSHRNTNFIQK